MKIIQTRDLFLIKAKKKQIQGNTQVLNISTSRSLPVRSKNESSMTAIKNGTSVHDFEEITNPSRTPIVTILYPGSNLHSNHAFHTWFGICHRQFAYISLKLLCSIFR